MERWTSAGCLKVEDSLVSSFDWVYVTVSVVSKGLSLVEGTAYRLASSFTVQGLVLSEI